MLARIKQFWLDNERNIVLILGFILVAIISFEAGLLEGRKNQEKPIIIEKMTTAGEEEHSNSSGNAPQGQNSTQGASAISNPMIQGQDNVPQNCAFVGSKNSNKYHLPTCRWAKNIKPENVVCFSSVEDAAAKGYQPDKNCIK